MQSTASTGEDRRDQRSDKRSPPQRDLLKYTVLLLQQKKKVKKRNAGHKWPFSKLDSSSTATERNGGRANPFRRSNVCFSSCCCSRVTLVCVCVSELLLCSSLQISSKLRKLNISLFCESSGSSSTLLWIGARDSAAPPRLELHCSTGVLVILRGEESESDSDSTRRL